MHILFDSDLKSEIIKATKKPFTLLNKEQKSHLIKLHQMAFFSELCKTCENEQILAYIELTRLHQNNFKMAKGKKIPDMIYEFNPESKKKKVVVSSLGWTITPETLTYNQAIYLIRSGAYPDLIIKKKPSKKAK